MSKDPKPIRTSGTSLMKCHSASRECIWHNAVSYVEMYVTLQMLQRYSHLAVDTKDHLKRSVLLFSGIRDRICHLSATVHRRVVRGIVLCHYLQTVNRLCLRDQQSVLLTSLSLHTHTCKEQCTCCFSPITCQRNKASRGRTVCSFLSSRGYPC